MKTRLTNIKKEVFKKERLIFIFHSCGQLTGTERSLLNWCRFIDYTKIDITICVNEGTFWEAFKKGVPYVKLINFKFSENKLNLGNFIRLFIYFKNLRTTKVIWILNDMIDFHFSELFPIWLAAKGNLNIAHFAYPDRIEKIKSRLWFGILPGVGLWRLKWFSRQFINHFFAKRIYAQSTKAKDCLVSHWKISSKKIFVSKGKGIDTEFFKPNNEAKKILRKQLNLSEKTRIFIAVNRFVKLKRIDRLLGALLLLIKDNLGVCLLLVGDGKLKEFYENRVKRNSYLLKNVIFLEFQDDINRFIQGADFLLLASDTEGQSNVIKEAMACGTIPIVTETPGCKEISDKIFMAERSVFDFYRQIKKILSLPEEKLNLIREQYVEEIKSKYNLRDRVVDDLKIFNLPVSS